MPRRSETARSHQSRHRLRVIAGVISAVVALTAVSFSGEATAKTSARTSTKKTTTKKTTTTRRRAVRTTTTKRRTAVRVTSTTTTRPLPTVVSVPTSPAPLPTAPTTTATTTTAAPAYDYELLVPTPAQSVAAGSSVSYLVIISTKAPSLPLPVTFIATGMPEGSNASLSPNPASSGAEFRVNVGPNVPVGTYTVRLIGQSNNVIKTVNVFVNVTASTNTTTSTSTTLVPGSTTSTVVAGAGSSTFAVVVSTDGSRLRTGGTVPYFVRILPAAGFTTPAALQVSGLPPGVSGGFSPMTPEGTSTLFVSSTVAIIPGTYTFNLVAVAGAFQQFVQLRLVIE